MIKIVHNLGLIQQMPHRDLYIILSIVLLCIFTVSKMIFPKLFSESTTWDKLFGFRIKEDLGSSIRPFSTEHIYFTALFSFNLSFVLLFMVNTVAADELTFDLLIVSGIGHGLLIWLLLGTLLNVAMYLKYVLLFLMGWLFHMTQTVSRHFTDYVNASALFYILIATCLALSTYSTFTISDSFVQVVLISIIIFVFYRTVLLYVKLIQLSPYSKLFIFSYICSTELIPVLAGVYFVLK